MAEQQQQKEIDLDSISLEDLRKLANEEAGQVEQPAAQPRDEQGRFTAQQPDPEAQPDAEEATETVVYRREIDLGDGAGKEVFEAPTIEELLDKIVTAKEHATKKIREQQARLREIEQSQQQSNADDEFVLSQELMSKPTEAIKKVFKQITGLDITEFKTVAERSRALEAAQTQANESRQQEEASAAFMQSHPEYLPNEVNGKRLVREINSLMGEAKAAGRSVDYASVLESAYTSLKNDGLLQLKSEGEAAQPAKATPQVQQTPLPAPRRASSLASRVPAVTQPRSNEPSEDELYSMPLAQLRELANRQARG